jgi:hypothetical protein
MRMGRRSVEERMAGGNAVSPRKQGRKAHGVKSGNTNEWIRRS